MDKISLSSMKPMDIRKPMDSKGDQTTSKTHDRFVQTAPMPNPKGNLSSLVEGIPKDFLKPHTLF